MRAAFQADAEVAHLDQLDRLERRLADLEDTVSAVLSRSRLDDLAEQLDELAMTSTTHDDLLGVRMHAARLAAEVSRTVTELRSEHARLATSFDDHLAGRNQAAAG
ncbi:MAG: hypothetical protein JWN67_1789 [Actinomycetia bacterium]|nr:hypothetical protein [Actinomycetes bacterium]